MKRTSDSPTFRLGSRLGLAAASLLIAVAADASLITPDRPWTFETVETIAQGTTGNGSFEGTGSGSVANWSNVTGGGGMTAVNTVPPGATDGSFSLRVFETGTGASTSRVDLRRRVPGFSTEDGLVDGNIFKVTLDYYVPSTAGYTQLVLTPLTVVGTTGTSLGLININPITTFDTWVTGTWWFQADTDGFNGFDFRVDFRRLSPVGGTTYEGFIDNVIIQQGFLIPEPSTIFLFGAGGLLLMWVRSKRS